MVRQFLAIILLTCCLVPTIALAQGGFDGGFDKAEETNLPKAELKDAIRKAVNFLLGLVAVVALAALVWGVTY